ncbi:MAG: aminodeoxychorismate lyase [Woeseiaceae bacterium]
MSRWYRNGEVIDKVSPDDRAFQYGDGLFETVAIRNGQPRLWNYHLDRLERGCEKLKLQAPDRDELRWWLDSAVGQNDTDDTNCTAKIIVTAGTSNRGYARRTPTLSTTYVKTFPTVNVPTNLYDEGVDTILCSTRLALFSVTAGCKTLNRIEQVLARSECLAQGAFEGLTLDADGRLICGTMSNVFIVLDKTVATPSLDRCGVEGVMRRHVIELLGNSGRRVSVGDISALDLTNADEVFLCNSQFGLLPVRQCAEKSWETHPVTRSIMSLMAENGISECAL